MSNFKDEFYKQKYLKYKAKYLEAKNELEGGLGLCQKCSFYIYFFSSDLFSKDTKPGVLDFLRNKSDEMYKKLSKIRSGCDFDKELFKLCNKKGKYGYLEIMNQKEFKHKNINIITSMSNFGNINYEKLKKPILSYHGRITNNERYNDGKGYEYSQGVLREINEQIKSEGFGEDWFYIIKRFPCFPFNDNDFAGDLQQFTTC
jgi:hypothetical protein